MSWLDWWIGGTTAATIFALAGQVTHSEAIAMSAFMALTACLLSFFAWTIRNERRK